jgi:hypothetical protein
MKTLFASMVAMTCLFASMSPAFAQIRDPGQQKTDYLWNGPRSSSNYSAHSAGTRIYDARQYTQQLYNYTTVAPAPNVRTEITKVESEHIGHTLAAAQLNLAVVKKEAEKTGDQAVVKKVEAIQKHLTSALEHHKKMNMECCMTAINGGAVAACCHDCLADLDHALAEHASLMRMLKPKNEPAAPEAPKTTTK